MYYTQNCPKCAKHNQVLNKLQNQMRSLIRLVAKAARGEPIREGEAKAILTQIDGEQRLYYEAE